MNSIMSSSKFEPVFEKVPTIANDYVINSLMKSGKPTSFERNVLYQYIHQELGFGNEKEINYDSQLVRMLVDFSRFYNSQYGQ